MSEGVNTATGELGSYHEIIGAFKIFDQYPVDPYIRLTHGRIYAGPNHNDVTPEHKATLKSLGWHTSRHSEVFFKDIYA